MPPRMAGSTGVDLVVGAGLPLPVHSSRVRFQAGPRPAGRLQIYNKTVRAVAWLVRSFLVGLRPRHMIRSRPVAGFARYIDLRPRSRVAIVREVIVLAQIGGVTVRAHVIPRLVASRPVQRISGRDLLVGIEVEPALAFMILAP